jgi:hypothetical protein
MAIIKTFVMDIPACPISNVQVTLLRSLQIKPEALIRWAVVSALSKDTNWQVEGAYLAD